MGLTDNLCRGGECRRDCWRWNRDWHQGDFLNKYQGIKVNFLFLIVYKSQSGTKRIKQHDIYALGESWAWCFCFAISLFPNLNNLTAICRNVAFLFGTSTVFGCCSQVLLNENFLREVGFAAGHIITISATSWRATGSGQQDPITILHRSSHYYESLKVEFFTSSSQGWIHSMTTNVTPTNCPTQLFQYSWRDIIQPASKKMSWSHCFKVEKHSKLFFSFYTGGGEWGGSCRWRSCQWSHRSSRGRFSLMVYI